MDDVQIDYLYAYKRANGKETKITKHTTVKYYLKGNYKGYTARQIAGFTTGLLKREPMLAEGELKDGG